MKQTPNLSPLFWASGIILSIVLLSLNACQKQEVEPEPIICPEANFRMEMYFAVTDTLLPVDTIFNRNNQVEFTASDLYETYEWRVGVDPRTWNDKELSLRFTDAVGNIPITFIGQRKVLEGCENASTEAKPIIDTLQRTLHVKDLPDPYWFPAPEPYLYEGTWRGAYTNSPDDFFEIQIVDNGPDMNREGWYGLRIFNFPEGCGGTVPNAEEYSPSIGFVTYKYFTFGVANIPGSCMAGGGLGVVYGAKNDSIRLERPSYSNYNIFIGKKVQ